MFCKREIPQKRNEETNVEELTYRAKTIHLFLNKYMIFFIHEYFSMMREHFFKESVKFRYNLCNIMI